VDLSQFMPPGLGGSHARAVWSDGAVTYVVGSGLDCASGHRHAVMWVGPNATSACRWDCNADGALTVADFGCFQSRFILGDWAADCNRDCRLTTQDFGCFQAGFVDGCR
jgi:hypothetical protein